MTEKLLNKKRKNKCMYINVKLVFRFSFAGHEFRQGPVFRRCVEETNGENKFYFQSNVLNFNVVWHKINNNIDFQL